MNDITIEEEEGLLVIRAKHDSSCEELINWQQHNNDQINQLLNKHGALLFRGFNIANPEYFQRYLDHLPESRLAYVDGNSPRQKLSSNIYTSTEYPPEFSISLHNELSYSHSWPQRLYFCCQVAPEVKGHTLIADCRKVLAQLDSSVIEAFTNKKVKYTRYLHAGQGVGPSWQDTFETQDKTEVENFCKNSEITYQWHDDGGIQLTQIGPGTLAHTETKESVWFNQADQFHVSNLPQHIAETLEILTNGDKSKYPTYAYFGDDSEIPAEMLQEVKQAFERNTIYFDWQQGDLLMIDNVLMAHGRSPFAGERKILVAMT